MTQQKNKGGRPKKDIDAEQVAKLAAMQCSNVEIAAFFDCDEGTIRKRFSEILTKGRERGKITLRRLQWKAAESGNTAILIWLGKQYLGQTEKIENTELDKPLPLNNYRKKNAAGQPDTKTD
jgi:hypothetical protein